MGGIARMDSGQAGKRDRRVERTRISEMRGYIFVV